MASAAPPPAASPPLDGEPRRTPPLGAPLRERGAALHDEVRAETWSARGVTKVVGAVEVGVGELAGTVVVGGTFSARDLSVRGSLEVVGTLTVAGELSLHGSIRAGGAVRAGEAALAGAVRIDGPVEVAGTFVTRGSLAAEAVTAREARLAGSVRVPGEVRAVTVELELGEGSLLGSAVGRSVRAVGPEAGALDRLLGKFRHARIERIEAESVTLEKVEVGAVKAREVVLGRDAHVGWLEATRVRAHPTARVGPESRSPPPPGLRR